MMNGAAEQQVYAVEEFSGGVTDYYLDGPNNAAEYMENLLLTPVRKLTTRPAITYFVDSQVNSSATRMYLMNHIEEPLLIQARKAWYKSGASAFTQVFGPNAGGATDPAMSDSSVSSGSICSSAYWRGHTFVTTDDIVYPQKFYKDVSAVWKVRTAGLPAPASLSGTSSSVGTTHTHLYAIVYMYSYTVGAQTFEDRSAPFLATVQTLNAIGAATITLTLPGFSGFGENWDAANIKQEIYRTIDNGQDFYRLSNGAAIAYNTLTLADTTTDAALLLNTALYTNGGVVDNDQPPKCKYLHIMGDTGYYGYLKDSAGTYAFQVRQSKPGDIDSVPADFNLDLRETVTGISSHNGKPLIMCTNEVSRVEGQFDQFGRGYMSAVQISPSAGCASHNSIVQTPNGVFWCGNDGVYHTEGYVTHKISPHLDESYAVITENATKRKRITGTYHADLQCVVWAVCRTEAANECDSLLVLDLRWGLRLGALDVKQTVATFYWWSGTTVSCPRWINRQLQLATSTGYLHYQLSTETSDVKFAATGTPSTWAAQTINWQWTSTATDFGTKQYRKWVPWFAVDCTSASNVSIGITSIVDNGKIVADLKPIRYRGNIIWGVTSVVWGDAGYRWNQQGTIDSKRRMKKNSLRSMHRQIQLTNAKVVVLNSALGGTVTVNQGLLTATLNGSLLWPSQYAGYLIAFSNDSYVVEYEIASISTNTVVFLDPGGHCPASGGGYSFVVRAYPKGEVLHLNGIQMWWMPISRTLSAFTTAGTGEPTA